MNRPSFGKRIAAVAAVLALCLSIGMTGCAAEETESVDPTIDISDTSGGIAATVNGEEIGENAVTAYIQHFREVQGLEDDEAWGQYLFDYAYTVDSFRGDTLTYFENRVLLRQAAEQQGVSVTQEELEEALATAIEEQGGEDAWKESLENTGLSVAAYREQMELSLLSAKLENAVTENVTGTDEEVLSSVKMYVEAYPGAKRSTQLLFDVGDEELAQEVLDKINSGELSFEDAVAQYSLDQEDEGDVGWDKLAEFEDEYQAALDDLEVGEMSGLVKSDTGIRIIMCTDELVLPEEGITSLDQVSDSFVEFVRSQIDESAKRQAWEKWFEDFKYASDIHEEYLPEGAVYWVDLTPYEDAAREAAQQVQDEREAQEGE